MYPGEGFTGRLGSLPGLGASDLPKPAARESCALRSKRLEPRMTLLGRKNQFLGFSLRWKFELSAVRCCCSQDSKCWMQFAMTKWLGFRL
jgi:hypothetical protein